MKNLKTTTTLITLALVLFAPFSFAQGQINFKTPTDIFPEGIAYYAKKDIFLVSSITDGL